MGFKSCVKFNQKYCKFGNVRKNFIFANMNFIFANMLPHKFKVIQNFLLIKNHYMPGRLSCHAKYCKSSRIRIPTIGFAKMKTNISCAVTAHLHI